MIVNLKNTGSHQLSNNFPFLICLLIITMIKVSMVVLNCKSGDAILSKEKEQILFQRLGGELILNSQYFVLENVLNRVKDINLPYTIRDIQSPFL